MFDMSERAAALHAQLLEFMDEHIYPNEALFHEQIAQGDRWQPTSIVESLKAKAKAAGLWNLWLPESEYGAGLTNRDTAMAIRSELIVSSLPP